MNSKATSIVSVDFGDRSLRYQQLVNTMKPPSPVQALEELAMTEEETELMSNVTKDVKNALCSMNVKDVGEVVVGFNL